MTRLRYWTVGATNEALCRKIENGLVPGRTWEPSAESLRESLDYLKLGPYLAALGPLNSRDTNQRFYRVNPKRGTEDETFRFWKIKTFCSYSRSCYATGLIKMPTENK